ncbi:MAG: glycosyltransferase family 2 protein [Sphingobium sp.]
MSADMMSNHPSSPPQPDQNTGREQEVAPVLSILIVTYNSRDFILDCIDSVIRHTSRTPYEILLVDNGPDGSGELVRRERPSVHILEPIGNVGFGAGNNYLAKAARGEFLLMLNPDTTLRDDAIDRLVEFARDFPQASAWGGRTITKADWFDGGNRIAIPTLPKLFAEVVGRQPKDHNRTDRHGITAPYRVDVLCGGYMMMKRDMWDKLGGFDPEFFLYFEEVDLFTRLRTMGGEAWVKPDSIIVHDVGSGNPFDPKRLNFIALGQMHYIRKHWNRAAQTIAMVLIWLAAVRRMTQGLLLGAFKPTKRAQFRGYAGIVFSPGSWKNGYQ